MACWELSTCSWQWVVVFGSFWPNQIWFFLLEPSSQTAFVNFAISSCILRDLLSCSFLKMRSWLYGKLFVLISIYQEGYTWIKLELFLITLYSRTLSLWKIWLSNMWSDFQVDTFLKVVLLCSVALVISNSLQSHGLWSTRILCPWNFPGKNTGEDCHFLLFGIVPT